MTERTITEADLNAVLTAVAIPYPFHYKDVMNAAFPPLFTPKKGEIIFVRYNDKSPWELKTFMYMDHSAYCCEENNHNKKFYWGQAKPQTPTQKGE
jgi:hypothetical protein